MNPLGNLKESAGSLGEFLQENLYSVLAVVLIIAIGLGYAFFYVSAVGPVLQSRDKLTIQLTDAQKALADARQHREESPSSLRTRVAVAQSTLAAGMNVFLTDAQASAVMNALYQYASASGVIITDLKTQQDSVQPLPTPLPTARPTLPPPTQPPPTQTGASQPTPTRPPATPVPVVPTPAIPSPVPKDVYYLTTYRLKAQGTSRQLIDFVSRIKEASANNFAISNLNLAGEGKPVVLTMDISLYAYIPNPTPVPVAVQPPRPTPAASIAVTVPPPPAPPTSMPSLPTLSSATAMPKPAVQPSPTRPLPTLLPMVSTDLIIPINASSTVIAIPSNLFTASSLIASINSQGGSVTEVDTWVGEKWLAYYAATKGVDFPIQSGVGYVVKAKSASGWRVSPAPDSATKTTRINKGWYLMGPPPCKDGSLSCYTASTLAAAINAQGGQVTDINHLLDGHWSGYRVGYTINDFAIMTGQGYFVYSTKSSEWTP